MQNVMYVSNVLHQIILSINQVLYAEILRKTGSWAREKILSSSAALCCNSWTNMLVSDSETSYFSFLKKAILNASANRWNL